MVNTVQLNTPLSFGKHCGRTPLELSATEKGINYLCWLYENTDIEIDLHIVNQLIADGLVKYNSNRKNSNPDWNGKKLEPGVHTAKVESVKSTKDGFVLTFTPSAPPGSDVLHEAFRKAIQKRINDNTESEIMARLRGLMQDSKLKRFPWD